MDYRPRRLRDFFDPPPNADKPPPPRETDELIDAVAESDPVDVEGFADRLKQSDQRLWHAVEDELQEDFRRWD